MFSSTSKVYYRQIKNLEFKPYLHEVPISVLRLMTKKPSS